MDIISFWPFTLIVALFATSSYVPLPAHAVLVIVSYLTIYAGAHASLDCTEEEVRAVAVSLAAARERSDLRLHCLSSRAILAVLPRRRRRRFLLVTLQCFLSAAR